MQIFVGNAGRAIRKRGSNSFAAALRPPIGSRTACHEPHGSDHFRILAESFPATFYTSLTGGQCEKTCHNARIYSNAKK